MTGCLYGAQAGSRAPGAAGEDVLDPGEHRGTLRAAEETGPRSCATRPREGCVEGRSAPASTEHGRRPTTAGGGPRDLQLCLIVFRELGAAGAGDAAWSEGRGCGVRLACRAMSRSGSWDVPRSDVGDRVEERLMDDGVGVAAEARAGEPMLVTVREAARLLALGRSTVYELIAAGRLPTVHIGRSVRIRPADLRALIDADDRDAAAM